MIFQCPIPKVKGLPGLSDKYRAITLISCFMKLFDYMILDNQKQALDTDNLQFGFKPNSSTIICSSLVSEISRIFKSHGSSVHAVMLDATKAFDRIEYARLFNILLNKGMDILYVRLLLYMYKNQKLRIKWNSHCSESFSVLNGVKQGGILSPVLFGLYLDELIVRLRNSGLGCKLGPHFLGCIAYADDIVILAPTKTGLINMLDITEDYATEFKVQFNGVKSQYIIFDREVRSKTMSINAFGALLPNLSSVIHLGHKLHSDCQIHDTDGIIAKFYQQFNSFRSKFGGIASVVQADL